MPPSARITVVEFRSLLLPPIRVSLRTVQSLYRPQCLSNRPSIVRSPQCLAQRRSLVLWKTAKAETTLGQHTILPFDRYKVADPGDSAHEVNLIRGNETIAENISLHELYEKHIKPGQLLYLTEAIPKALAQNVGKMKTENTALQRRTYGIVETGTLRGNKKDPDAGKGQGAFRVTPLSLSSPPEYYKVALDRSYQFIYHGSPVEFTIAIKRSPVKKEDKWKGIDDKQSWPWIHEHFPHLRPDFILKSMPEGSKWSVEPVSDGRLLQFVIIRPSPLNKDPVNYTERLFKVKESVKKHIARGGAQQLPSLMRKELAASGHETYSPLSSMPIKRGSLSEQSVRLSKEATEDWRSPDSRNRYAPVERVQLIHTDKLSKSGRLRKDEKHHPQRFNENGSATPGFKKVGRLRLEDEDGSNDGNESGWRERKARSSSRRSEVRFDNGSSRREDDRFENCSRPAEDTEHGPNEAIDSYGGDDGWGFKIRKHSTGPDEGPMIRHHESSSPSEDGPRILKRGAMYKSRPVREVALTNSKTGTWGEREPGLKRNNDPDCPLRSGERVEFNSHERRINERKHPQTDGEEGGFKSSEIDSRGSGFRKSAVSRRNDDGDYPRRKGDREGGFRRTNRQGPTWSSRRSPSED